MAITKLDHLKESKKGNPAAHLKNAIRYILNPEKTNGGMFVGGNCGTSAEEIYASMISTKEFFGKTGGRKGYHFVISFSPGEASCEEAFQIGKEFCEQYFSNAYEYVYAVHRREKIPLYGRRLGKTCAAGHGCAVRKARP